MSTMRHPLRFLRRNLSRAVCLGLALGAAGCSTTAGTRTGAAPGGNSKMKTFLSVGDKPLPVVSGAPGSAVAADAGDDDAARAEAPASRRRVRPDGRISGRVYDDQGRPVPQARVRLAVGASPGGKVVSATTDRSGAFTLHNLRPDSDYTLVAEWEGDDGLMTGRAEAQTAETDVTISLAPQADEAPGRVSRVSDREPAGDADADADGPLPEPAVRRPPPRRAVNEEDLPPADEAEPLTPAVSTSPSPSTAPAGLSWRGTRAGPGHEPAPADPEARGTAAPPPAPAPAPAADLDLDPVSASDDGPNPLPPALERGPDPSASNGGADAGRPLPGEPDPPRVAARQARPEPEPDPGPGPYPVAPLATRRPAASSAFESPTRPTNPPATAPEPAADDVAPGALVVVPESFAPVATHDPDPFAGSRVAIPEEFREKAARVDPGPDPEPAPAPTRAKPRSRPAASTAARARVEPKRSAAAAASPAATASATAVAATAGGTARRRPKWGEVASSPGPSPAAGRAGESLTDAGVPKADPGVARRTLAVAGSEEVSAPKGDGAAPALCEYDDRLRRIIDFRLPDLDGKPVRFQDLDTDLVLLDFWGTWCPPCLRSIPHLVGLQEKMGGKRLTVVGVACEAESPAAAAVKVADTVRRLNVNYPILLSRNDGSCPLQEALHVSAFPTMVLVDRQGRVLWRDQGATPATLARLDRMLATTPVPDTTRR